MYAVRPSSVYCAAPQLAFIGRIHFACAATRGFSVPSASSACSASVWLHCTRYSFLNKYTCHILNLVLIFPVCADRTVLVRWPSPHWLGLSFCLQWTLHFGSGYDAAHDHRCGYLLHGILYTHYLAERMLWQDVRTISGGAEDDWQILRHLLVECFPVSFRARSLLHPCARYHCVGIGRLANASVHPVWGWLWCGAGWVPFHRLVNEEDFPSATMEIVLSKLISSRNFDRAIGPSLISSRGAMFLVNLT